MEIVSDGGLLYSATNGGIIIYDPADSSFQQFTSKDGLPSNFITALTFDSAGELYVGSEDAGIARVRFVAGGLEVAALSASFHGLTDDRITTITAWGDTLVYGSKNGAGVIVQGFPAAQFFERHGLPDNQVNDVLADGDQVWIATDSGVTTIDRLGFFHDLTAGLPSVQVNVIERADTALWVGMARGVARFNSADSSWSSLGISHRPVHSLFWDDSVLWAGTNSYVYRHDGVSWDSSLTMVPLYVKHNLSSTLSQIRSIVRGTDGNLYIGTADPVVWRRGGDLIVYDGATLNDIRPNAPGGTYITRLSVDLDASLWVATAGFGVGKLTPDGEWVNYNTTTPGGTGLSGLFLNLALLADATGSKWFAAPNTRPLDELQDQLDKDYGNDIWIHHDIGSGGGDGLGSVQFLRAREDPAGNRWFVADELPDPDDIGIHILSRNKTEWLQITPTTTGGEMWGGKIFDVTFDPGGAVYVANEGSGVQRWFTGGYDWATLSNLSGDIWSTVAKVGEDEELASEAELRILTLGNDGALWIGTTAGLYKYSSGQFKRFTAKRDFRVGLLGNEVKDLVFDRDGNLWVATDMGLNRIARDDEDDIAAYTTPAVWQGGLNQFFDQSVISPLVNANCEALALHPDEDVLFIGTQGGLSAFDISPAALAPTDLSSVYLYPNPVMGRQGHGELKIANITGPVVVEIYTIEGELVHSQKVGGPSEPEVWDLTTAEGFFASSGIYFVRIISNGQSIVKTISLIR
ncbi:MAG: T9SS type A sorting domain-containing protein [Candidatus Latescibacteria bacterium]|nr:T9SS type A sorting domain-containing protein [Candidatus Latescibacterota bacterium]NIM65225.1 T9SS type A sorting domain-containing protein [Candidatus Latescibacterota bacterium]NIO77294.1 T9SS type A sorting domain-containing protein [Candidatus Latescibacterota bacterium]NIT01771.1 T9SS type A sorting domain-containing protein [Candidatus Latescibacterota bacterium]